MQLVCSSLSSAGEYSSDCSVCERLFCFFFRWGIFHDQVTCFVQSQLHSAALAALAMQSVRDVELLFHGQVERQKLHKSPGGSRFHLFSSANEPTNEVEMRSPVASRAGCHPNKISLRFLFSRISRKRRSSCQPPAATSRYGVRITLGINCAKKKSERS